MLRKMMVGLTLAAMLLVSGISFAQTDVVCGTLAEADCAILTQSAEAMAEVSSSTFDMAFEINTGTQGALTIAADGAFEFTGEIGETDLAALNSADPTVAFGVLKNLLANFKGTLNLSLSGTPEVGLPGDVAISLVLVDGIGYLNFAELAPLAGPSGDQMLTQFGITDWAGLDLVGAIDLLGGMATGMETTPTDPAAAEELNAAIANYVTITREADVDGQAVFSTSIDFAGLLSEPAFADLVAAQAEAQGTDPEMLAGITEGISVTATSTIDLATFFQTSVSFDLNISGAALQGSGVESISITGVVNYDNFNSAPAITAPAGPVATVMDLMNLMGGAGF
jgi:hypothetical protein